MHQGYPGITERVRSIYIDLFVVAVLLILISQFSETLEHSPKWITVALVIIIILYEPLFVAFFGGSLGHFANGLRVKRNDDHSKNINIFVSVFRYLVKLFLGVISFITIQGSDKSRAIHDIVADSVVIFKPTNQ